MNWQLVIFASFLAGTLIGVYFNVFVLFCGLLIPISIAILSVFCGVLIANVVNWIILLALIVMFGFGIGSTVGTYSPLFNKNKGTGNKP